MKIYLATANKNKRKEFSQILGAGDRIVIPSDEDMPFDPVETGSTFYENSMIKARALWNIVHEPVIADDSGLCIDILGGVPGVYSSRYAGPLFPRGKPDGKKIPQEEQNRLLIKQVNDTLNASSDVASGKFKNGPRSCRYICSIVLLFDSDRFFIVQETMEGCLVKSMQDAAGTGGFGYDPLFYLPQYGKTVAQLAPNEKNAISHRGKAVRTIASIIEKAKKQ